jgi:hypothetical protein
MTSERRARSTRHFVQTCTALVSIGVVAACVGANGQSGATLAQKPAAPGLPIDRGGSQVVARTSTGGGSNHGITYRVFVTGTFPLLSTGGPVVVEPDAGGFVMLNVDCPSVAAKPFAIDFDLDAEPLDTPAAGLGLSTSTSFGFRGDGEMPTALHPRFELGFKGKKGNYGSALLIRDVQLLGFVSAPLSAGKDKTRRFIIVATGFAASAAPA